MESLIEYGEGSGGVEENADMIVSWYFGIDY